MDIDKYITITEAADIIGIKRASLRRLCNKRQVACILESPRIGYKIKLSDYYKYQEKYKIEAKK